MDFSIDEHPLLDAVLLHTVWPNPLAEIEPLPDLDIWFSDSAQPPLERNDDLKTIVRDLLRHGGFKPSGRSKPASEYLLAAVAKGLMSSINPAVDCCNVASLHSGLPISVVDAHRGTGPWRIGLAEPNTQYVFNPTGQVIDIGGLVVLFDAEGPCGGPVKDSQRTKTHAETTETVSVVWGTKQLDGRSRATADWYTALMQGLGATVTEIRPRAPGDHLG
jgi:DNA/RNA-binding domain of Phe-tRNA-synthetase-like protein